jgi:hypothetical protein
MKKYAYSWPSLSVGRFFMFWLCVSNNISCDQKHISALCLSNDIWSEFFLVGEIDIYEMI